MAIRVGINGFGRIGRQVVKIMRENYDVTRSRNIGGIFNGRPGMTGHHIAENGHINSHTARSHVDRERTDDR